MAWKKWAEIFRIILWTFVIKTKNWTLIHSILGQFQGQFSSLSLCLFYSNKWRLLSFLLDRPSFFTHTLQIHCLGLLGLNPILFWVQPKFGPYRYFFFFNSKFFYFYFNPNPNVCLSNIAICPYINSHLLSSMAPSINYYFNFNLNIYI